MPAVAATQENGEFRFHIAIDEVFEKADDGDEKRMRIAGVISTDARDKQGERILQDGLDFDDFLRDGWFNDNHAKDTTGIVGYPTQVHKFEKRDSLPNGKIAGRPGWWVEGYLLNDDHGRKIWGKAQALMGTPRRLGFSIEGKVEQRAASDKTTIARATIRNVAVTHCPVNPETELVPLLKALTAGHAIANPGASPGQGFALRAESLDDDHEYDLSKAEPPDEPMSDEDFLESWAPALKATGRRIPTPQLDKSLAGAYVRYRFPHVISARVDALVQKAMEVKP